MLAKTIQTSFKESADSHKWVSNLWPLFGKIWQVIFLVVFYFGIIKVNFVVITNHRKTQVIKGMCEWDFWQANWRPSLTKNFPVSALVSLFETSLAAPGGLFGASPLTSLWRIIFLWGEMGKKAGWVGWVCECQLITAWWKSVWKSNLTLLQRGFRTYLFSVLNKKSQRWIVRFACLKVIYVWPSKIEAKSAKKLRLSKCQDC